MEMEEVSTLALTVIGAKKPMAVTSSPSHPKGTPMSFGTMPTSFLSFFFL
jgi:hypothetical protein